MKEIEFKRNVLFAESKDTREMDDNITVEIKPGYGTETVLTFPRKGNEAFGAHPSDLVVKFR